MKLWWLTDSVRLGAEKRDVDSLSQTEEWFALDRWTLDQGRLTAEGTIFAHDSAYAIRLIYPDQFPLVPAWVEPKDETRWTTHQYGKGTLCLELRPDNWTPEATGVDVLRSAFSLLFTEDPLGEGGVKAPSEHNVGDVQIFSLFDLPVFIGEGCLRRLETNKASKVRAIRWWVDDVIPILVYDDSDLGRSHRPPGVNASASRIVMPAFVSYCPPPKNTADRASLVQAGDWDDDTANMLLTADDAVVLFLGGLDPAAFSLINDAEPFRRSVHILHDQDGARTAASEVRSQKSVTIVGAGSVGSKIAECLVRSGVRHLKIIDGDIMLPGNLERHSLDWRDVGSRKSTAVKNRLMEVSPGANIEAITSNLNWQRSSRTHAWQMDTVAEGDVIIDATGDPATALFLGAIAEANQRAFVAIEVFEGGIGGLIATVLPKRDPPYAQGRANFIGWCNEQDAPPPDPGPRAYEALSPEGSPIAADDAAVTAIAGHGARTVLDILDGNPPPIESAWLLIGLRDAWLFKGAGDNIRLNVGPRPSAPEGAKDTSAHEFALDLLKEAIGET